MIHRHYNQLIYINNSGADDLGINVENTHAITEIQGESIVLLCGDEADTESRATFGATAGYAPVTPPPPGVTM